MNNFMSCILVTAEFERNSYENEMLNDCILDWAYFFHDYNLDHRQFKDIVFKDMVNRLIRTLESYKTTMNTTSHN